MVVENKIIGFYNNDNIECDIDKSIYVKIELLGRGKELEKNCFLISKSSLEKVIRHNWYLDSNGYPMTYTGRSKTLHKNLLGKQQKGYVIDHINRDKLDNRLENLRVITSKENSYNRTKNKSSNNIYKGVSKRGNKYVASITKDGIKKEITGFETEEDAAKVYDMMAQELFGEFAGLNFPNQPNLIQ
jgi:hypothetical protein